MLKAFARLREKVARTINAIASAAAEPRIVSCCLLRSELVAVASAAIVQPTSKTQPIACTRTAATAGSVGKGERALHGAGSGIVDWEKNARGPRLLLTHTAMWTPRRDVITTSTEPLNRPTVNPIPDAVGPLAWHLMAPGDCTGKTWVQSVSFRAGCRGRTCGGRVSKQLTRTTRSASVRYTCNKRAYTRSISFHSTENR